MMLDTMKALCAIDGVSGDEGRVRDYILAYAAKNADEVRTDVNGNVIALKKGASRPKNTLMLCAHMDEVGIIITGIESDGYLKFACVGGIDRRVLIGKQVYIGENCVFGVISSKAIHLTKADERKKIPAVDKMYIDIGAADEAEAKKLVSLGDTGAFAPGIMEFGSGYIKAKAIDDRFGCAVLLDIMSRDIAYDCYFVFTVQEEVGTRGAFTSAFSVRPDIALVVEGTTAADLPSVSGTRRVCTLGGGAVIPFMDGGTIYDRGLYTLLTKTAEENGIKWQTKSLISGGTDASAIQRSREGVRVAAVSLATRNIHSPSCVARIDDMKAAGSLAELFIEKVGEI